MTGRKYKNMITSTYDWKINTKEPDAGFFKLAKEHGLAETAAKIAYERGVTTEEALEDFLKAIYHTFMTLIFFMIWTRQWLEFVRPLRITSKF